LEGNASILLQISEGHVIEEKRVGNWALSFPKGRGEGGKEFSGPPLSILTTRKIWGRKRGGIGDVSSNPYFIIGEGERKEKKGL